VGKLSELRAHFAFFLNADSPLVLFNLAGVGYKFGAWARIAARPGLMTASLIRRAGAWSWEPCRAGRLVPRKLLLSYAGSIGDRSMHLPGGVVVRPKTPKSPKQAEDKGRGGSNHQLRFDRYDMGVPRNRRDAVA
jgi:hypothetical protein